MRGRVMAMIALAMVTAACGSLPLAATPTPSATPSRTATPRPASTPTVAATPSITVLGLAAAPSQAQPVLLAAAADLAERLKLPEGAEVTVKAVTEREWADASLGCPQPGMVYAQVITPGYEVVLEAGGKEYTYHTDAKGNAVSCDGEGEDGGKGQGLTVKDGSPSQPKDQGEVDTSRITPVPRP